MVNTATYLAPLAAVVVVTAALTVVARRWPGRWLDRVVRLLVVLLVAAEASWWVHLALEHSWTLSDGLPLQLCDAASVIAAAALWRRHWVLVEITYFWGLAGTTQALLTPGVADSFPQYLYFQHYWTHGSVVMAAVLLVVGFKIRPRRYAVPRMIGWTFLFVVLVGAVDLVSGADYMYLRNPPPIRSLLNFMGPWPWYLLTGTVVAVLSFCLLDVPFQVMRRKRIDTGFGTPYRRPEQ